MLETVCTSAARNIATCLFDVGARAFLGNRMTRHSSGMFALFLFACVQLMLFAVQGAPEASFATTYTDEQFVNMQAANNVFYKGIHWGCSFSGRDKMIPSQTTAIFACYGFNQSAPFQVVLGIEGRRHGFDGPPDFSYDIGCTLGDQESQWSSMQFTSSSRYISHVFEEHECLKAGDEDFGVLLALRCMNKYETCQFIISELIMINADV